MQKFEQLSSAQPGGRKLLSLSAAEQPVVFLGCINVSLYRRIFIVNQKKWRFEYGEQKLLLGGSTSGRELK